MYQGASLALGQGFRCGFLGLLHLEIVQERLEREYDLSIILSVPSVKYRLTLKTGAVADVDNPLDYPDPMTIAKSEEPYIRATMMMPERYVGAVMKLCMDKRGMNSALNYPGPGRAELVFEMPLAEVIYDFYDRFKSVTQGYGSFDTTSNYRESQPRVRTSCKGDNWTPFQIVTDRARARARLRAPQGGDPCADFKSHPGPSGEITPGPFPLPQDVTANARRDITRKNCGKSGREKTMR